MPESRRIDFGHRSVAKPDGSGPDSWWSYECGHCGEKTSGAILARAAALGGERSVRWLQCSGCHEPSVEDSSGRIHPGISFGSKVQGLPADVGEAYEEARRCLAINADIAAEGMCRKLLMHVAVEKGAKDGGSFAGYLDYLAKEGYVTPAMKSWVDLIRQHGNDSQHKLEPRDRKRAERTLVFTAHLLRNVYEMGHLAEEYIPKPEAPKAIP